MKTDTKLSEKELELISRSLDEDLSELERRRLNQKILEKEQAVQTWHRYHAISAVMRKQFPAKLDKDFSQRVLSEIEHDSWQEEAPERTGITRATSSFKHIAGLAVAASVAAVSVMSYQYFNRPVTDPASLITSEQIQPAETPTAAPSLTVEFSPAQLSEEQNTTPSVPEVDEDIYYQQMSPYIQDHVGFGSQRVMSPYEDIIELEDVQE